MAQNKKMMSNGILYILLPDYSFDTMPDDYAALVQIGGFGWCTFVAEELKTHLL